MKIITICGSMKFQKEIMEIAEKLALEGNCVLTPIYPAIENIELTDEQIEILKEGHRKKIALSDAIYVVNVDNHIGASTSFEIQYAKMLGKEVIYYINDKH